MESKPPIRAILFDMDDTLLDWSKTHTHAWQDYERRCLRHVWNWLAKHGPVPPFPQFDQAFFHELYAHWRRGKKKLVAPHLADILLDALAQVQITDGRRDREALLAAYGDEPPPGIHPFPDVLPALSELERRGLRFGIITNASHPMSLRDETLRAHGLIDFFPTCRLSAADIGYLKPHRAIFEHALAELGVGPEETFFVGDNLVADIHGAQEAGITAIWRPRDGEDISSQNTPLFPIIPDATIHSLAELLPLLDART